MDAASLHYGSHLMESSARDLEQRGSPVSGGTSAPDGSHVCDESLGIAQLNDDGLHQLILDGVSLDMG